MFANFFYFIIALLIYSTYQPSDATNFTAFQSLLLFLFLLVVYTAYTWRQFQGLNRRMAAHGNTESDSRFTSLLTRQSILAIFIFAANIYGLNLSSFVSNFRLFILFPTLQAILFILLFIGYLSILWACAHRSYQMLYHSRIGRRAYVTSNISFSMPVLLPWVVISGFSDIIHILPMGSLTRFLSTPEGEIVYFMVFLVIVAVMGPLLIQKFWGCRPLEQGVHRTRIESLCESVNLGYRNILHWPIFEGRIITAGVMGLVKRFRYILVTRALLNLLDPHEVDAVIAHEIGHVKKRHLLFYLLFFVGYMIISFSLLDLIVYAMIYFDPLIKAFNRMGFNPVTVTSLVFSLVIITTFLIYFRFIFGFFMRNFERQADAYVFTIFDTATSLISTLKKISFTGKQSPDKPNWHHFSITERIEFLKKCEIDRTHVGKQNRKIRKSIGVYLVGLVMIGGVGYQLNYGEAGRVLNTHFFEKVIMKELAKTPDNVDLHTMMGDLYFSRNNYGDAASQYEKAIEMAPQHARALNNLAWLYATCEETSCRDPERALVLAKRVAALEKEAHILDTLAESYFINGDIEAALATEKEALAIAKKDRAYYLEQIARFEEMLEISNENE
ncbi:MAG: peptidase [Deltaproteobacteria bacterium]|nr:MAG: peptidase [Deltaproteobacteria bacterium]RLC18797.1 MAG: peptidase [Deltaproteobacteria bacterium]HHE73785.1 tetratricopeptide repeat protein [Desulfobacteraceae bacterium]